MCTAQGWCMKCGGHDELACPAPRAACNDPNDVVSDGRCFPCGGRGQLACPAPRAACNGTDYVLGFHCVACGIENHIPCPDGTCAPGYTPFNGSCVGCGTPGLLRCTNVPYPFGCDQWSNAVRDDHGIERCSSCGGNEQDACL